MIEKRFTGDCAGVKLRQRGENDLHVVFELLVYDDDLWHQFHSGSMSSHWLRELQDQLYEAEKWMRKNCLPDMQNGRQYGWCFSPDEEGSEDA
jgi:hypothetical protein